MKSLTFYLLGALYLTLLVKAIQVYRARPDRAMRYVSLAAISYVLPRMALYLFGFVSGLTHLYSSTSLPSVATYYTARFSNIAFAVCLILALASFLRERPKQGN